MNTLSQNQGLLFLMLFAVLMLLITLIVSRNKIWTGSRVGFLKAGGKVHWSIGAFSIAASWIWAPALFVSVQKSFELGVAGLFWFTFPNILALVVFAWLAPKIRNKLPGGYTFPDWIKYRFNDSRIHKIYLILFLWYQVMAITVQVFVGGLLVSYLTGINLNVVMLILTLTGLSYSLISGMRASVITDFIQILMIFIISIIIIPWTIKSTGGWISVTEGLGGLVGHTNIFDSNIMYSFGIVTAIGLIAGSINDQQYWQRSFSIDKRHLVKAFVWGGLIFGIVPITLSVLGFLGANPSLGVSMPEGVQLPMIGVEVVTKFLPMWASILFVTMLLSGLSSTLDSGFSAGASLWAIDAVSLSNEEKNVARKERLDEELTESELKIKMELDRKTPSRARLAMIGLALSGLIVAILVEYVPGFGLDKLWWVFNGIASMSLVPTILSLFYPKLSAKGVLLGFAGSFIGIVGFIWGNATSNTDLIVGSAIFIIAISLIMNFTFTEKNKQVSQPSTFAIRKSNHTDKKL